MPTEVKTIFAIDNQGRVEYYRQKLVALVFVFYWLLVVEGAIRKWALPQLESAIFFLRVPVALRIYFLAVKSGWWPRKHPVLTIGACFGAVAIPLVWLQILGVDYKPGAILFAAYGWYSYFFYIPLAFIVAAIFSAEDFTKLIRHTILMGLISLPIVLVQFNSPADSWINTSSLGDEDTKFQSLVAALGRVRPTGLFTSSVGNGFLVVTGLGLVLGAWFADSSRYRLSPLWSALGAGAFAINLAFSGSRGLFMFIAAQITLLIFASLVTKQLESDRRSLPKVTWLVLGTGAFAAIWIILLPDAFATFMERWTSAYETESKEYSFGPLGRALRDFTRFVDLIPDLPLQGYLLGTGGNAAQFSSTDLQQGFWLEDAFSRNVFELGPLVGILFVAYRVGMAAWLLLISYKAMRHSRDLMPVILSIYIAVQFLAGSITGQGTVQGYCWLFLGICLASIRLRYEAVPLPPSNWKGRHATP